MDIPIQFDEVRFSSPPKMVYLCRLAVPIRLIKEMTDMRNVLIDSRTDRIQYHVHCHSCSFSAATTILATSLIFGTESLSWEDAFQSDSPILVHRSWTDELPSNSLL